MTQLIPLDGTRKEKDVTGDREQDVKRAVSVARLMRDRNVEALAAILVQSSLGELAAPEFSGLVAREIASSGVNAPLPDDDEAQYWAGLYGKIYDILDATDLRYRANVAAIAEQIIETIQGHENQKWDKSPRDGDDSQENAP